MCTERIAGIPCARLSRFLFYWVTSSWRRRALSKVTYLERSILSAPYFVLWFYSGQNPLTLTSRARLRRACAPSCAKMGRLTLLEGGGRRRYERGRGRTRDVPEGSPLHRRATAGRACAELAPNASGARFQSTGKDAAGGTRGPLTRIAPVECQGVESDQACIHPACRA